jgi:hypothetical protein
VCELSESTGAEVLARFYEPDQSMLEPAALILVGRPAQDLQSPVDLNRVAADCDRVLPILTEPLRDRDRYPGLADRGRPK